MTTDLTFFTNEPDAALHDVQFFDVRGQGPHAAQWERELTALVYELYGLTEDEIALTEEQTGRSTRP